MMTIRTAHVHLAVLLCCTTHAVTAQAARDSAGVRIIDNATPTWTPGGEWRLSAKPVLEIGSGAGPNHEFTRIAGVTRLSDGRVVVAEESTLQLMFYDSTGRRLKSVGGKGEGPGEFRDFVTISRLAGDSIAVEMRRGATIVAPTGAVVRKVEYGPFPPGALQTPVAYVLSRFDNGTAVVMDFPQGQHGPAGARRWVDSSSLFLVDHAGAVMRPLGKAPVVVFVAGTSRPVPLDLGPDAPHASTGRATYLGFNDQYAVRVYNSDWKLDRIIRRAWTPQPLTARDLDAYVDGWLKLWSKKTGAELEAERKEMRQSTYPESLPAYSAILASPGGELWVRDPDLSGAPGCWCFAGLPTVPSKWSVFDAGGRWLGDIPMPPRFIPVEIGADYVLGRSRDADNVPHVMMYRIEKPR